MPTVSFLEPGTDATFDTAFYSTGASGTGAVTSDTGQSHTGTRSLKCATTAANDTALASVAIGVVADAGAAISFWFRVSSAAPSVATLFAEVIDASLGNSILGVALNTNGKLIADGIGTTKTNGSATLLANTWTRITLAYIITSVSNWSASIYVNGVLDISLSNGVNGNLSAASTNSVQFGIDTSGDLAFTTSSILSEWFDDIYIDNRSDKSDPGDIRVTAKRPFANGTTNGFTTQIGAGGSGYGSGHAPQVNEQPLSQTNGWSMINLAPNAITEEYNIEGLTVGDVDLTGATIVDAMGWLFAKALASETGSLVLKGASSNISLTSTATLFTKAAGSSTYPAGTGTDIGIVTATTLTTVSLYEAGILIAYNPAAAGGAVIRPSMLTLTGVQ